MRIFLTVAVEGAYETDYVRLYGGFNEGVIK